MSVPDGLITVDGVNLSSWTKAQRRARHIGQLDNWQIDLLDRVGFSWSPGDEQRYQRLAELANFVAHNGHIKVPGKTPLRSWLYQQRKKRRLGTLPDETAAELSEIDPFWYSESDSLTSEHTRRFFQLTDRPWANVRPLIPEPVVGSEIWRDNDLRSVVENIIWKLRTGARWDDMNIDYGSPVTVSAWYYQWDKDGIWTQIEKAIALYARRS